MSERVVELAARRSKEQRFDELRKRLAAAVRRCCPRWLRDDAEDIAQNAVLRLLRQEANLGVAKEMSGGYLYRVAYSAVIDEVRARGRTLERSAVAIDDPESADVPAPDGAPEGMSGAINDCLQALSEDRRRAVTLYLLGHGITEAARFLEWPTKRVENLIYRTLPTLRDCVEAKGYKP